MGECPQSAHPGRALCLSFLYEPGLHGAVSDPADCGRVVKPLNVEPWLRRVLHRQRIATRSCAFYVVPHGSPIVVKPGAGP